MHGQSSETATDLSRTKHRSRDRAGHPEVPDPADGAFDFPAPLVAPKGATVLPLRLDAIVSVRADQREFCSQQPQSEQRFSVEMPGRPIREPNSYPIGRSDLQLTQQQLLQAA